ncbi:MAG: hypothetical protein Q9226_003201 [Calogaya cf. arnoldii]
MSRHGGREANGQGRAPADTRRRYTPADGVTNYFQHAAQGPVARQEPSSDEQFIRRYLEHATQGPAARQECPVHEQSTRESLSLNAVTAVNPRFSTQEPSTHAYGRLIEDNPPTYDQQLSIIGAVRDQTLSEAEQLELSQREAEHSRLRKQNTGQNRELENGFRHIAAVEDQHVSETERTRLRHLNLEIEDARHHHGRAQARTRLTQSSLNDSYRRIQQRIQAESDQHPSIVITASSPGASHHPTHRGRNTSTHQPNMVLNTGHASPRVATALSPPPRSAPTSGRFIGMTTSTSTPSSRKRSSNQRDDVEDALDTDSEGRRVRPRMNVGYPPRSAPENERSRGLITSTSTLSSRKRSSNQRDDVEDVVDADLNGRRVRPRTNVGYLAAHTPSNTNASGQTYIKDRSAAGRHHHPSQFLHPSRPTSHIQSSQPSMAVNNTSGGVPVNTAPQALNPNTNYGNPDHPLQPPSTHLESKFQSWTKSVSSTVHNAYNGYYTGFPNTPGPTGSYLPMGDPLDPSNHAEVPAHQASGPPNGKPTKKRKPAAEEPTADGTADGDEQEPKIQRVSKRQTKRQNKIADGAKLPRDSEKEMGKVEPDDAGQVWVTIKNERFKAAYHNQRRDALLARADAQGRYAYPLAHGYAENDRTAFHPAYANIDWADRHARPDVLFQWTGPQKGQGIHPGYMRDPEHDDCILISKDGHPILNYPELPTVLRSQIEGLLMEYWTRINPDTGLEDRRDLTKDEASAIRSSNRRVGTAQSRAGGRALCEADKKKVDAEKLAEATKVLERLRQEKANDDAQYAITESTLIAQLIGALSSAPPQGAHHPALAAPAAPRAPQAPRGRPRGTRRVSPAAQPIQHAPSAPPRGAQQSWQAVLLGPQGPPVQAAASSTLEPAPETHLMTQEALQLLQGYVNEHPQDDAQTSDPWTDEGNTTLVEDHAAPATINPGKPLQGLKENHTNSTAPPYANMPPYQPADFRYIVPATDAERDTITSSLYVTREEYPRYTGSAPPMTDMMEYYMYQQSQLQSSIADFYRQHRPYGEVPILVQRPAWYHSWNAWKKQKESDLFNVGDENEPEVGEATKSGSSSSFQEPGSMPRNAEVVEELQELNSSDFVHDDFEGDFYFGGDPLSLSGAGIGDEIPGGRDSIPWEVDPYEDAPIGET